MNPKKETKRLRWNKTFLGVRQQHTYWLYKVIDDILLENPQIEKFVEIGTGWGALSVVLGLHSILRGTSLLTIDVKNRHETITPIFEKLGIDWQEANCFDERTVKYIDAYIEGKSCFFFCDGDDKPREFNSFVRRLPAGSIICGHDYSDEIREGDISRTVEELELEPIHEEDWVGGTDDIRTCFFLKRK